MGQTAGKPGDRNWPIFPIRQAVRPVVPPAEHLVPARTDDGHTAPAATITQAGERRAANADASRKRCFARLYKHFGDWLPRLSTGPAILLLLTNTFLPGIGTMLFSLKWLYSPGDFIIETTRSQRSTVALTCFLYGFIQLLLTPFIFGWLWAVTTGAMAIQQAKWVSLSETHSKAIDKQLKAMMQARTASARGAAGLSVSDVTVNDGERAYSPSLRSHLVVNALAMQDGQYTTPPSPGRQGHAFDEAPLSSKAASGAALIIHRGAARSQSPAADQQQQQPGLQGSDDDDDDMARVRGRTGEVRPLDTTMTADEQAGAAEQQLTASRSSGKNLHKSALNVSLNRILPAPTPAAQFVVPGSQQQEPSHQPAPVGGHDDDESQGKGDDDNKSKNSHQEKQSEQTSAWVVSSRSHGYNEQQQQKQEEEEEEEEEASVSAEDAVVDLRTEAVGRATGRHQQRSKADDTQMMEDVDEDF